MVLPVCAFERSRGGQNVFFAGTGQGSNTWSPHFAADAIDGGKVARGGNRETGFQDIDAQGFEPMGHTQFLRGSHAAARDCSPSRNVVSKKNTRS